MSFSHQSATVNGSRDVNCIKPGITFEFDSFMYYAVVVENVRIYHDLGYILVICEYLQHKILECLRRRAKPTDAFAVAY